MKLLKKKQTAALSQSIEKYIKLEERACFTIDSIAYNIAKYGDKKLTISYLCTIYNVTRQTYYEYVNRQTKKLLQKEIILQLIKEQKRILPNCGVRKIYHLIKHKLDEKELKCGRDQLFELHREAGLLVKRKRSYVKTTNSNHPFRKYSNLLKDKEIAYVFHAVVCDITYIDTHEGFYYLALMMDVHSRYIVGYDLSDSLELEGCKRALEMALKLLKKVHPKNFAKNNEIIHHSDHGVQYCSYIYTDILKQHNIHISMGEIGNCYENAMAESLNGILKNELELGQRFVNKPVARKTVEQSINIYNTIRPHGSLKMQTPDSVFKQNVLNH